MAGALEFMSCGRSGEFRFDGVSFRLLDDTMILVLLFLFTFLVGFLVIRRGLRG